MHLEYFRLIDRILEFDPAGRTIRAEAIVPTQSTIFEGHFPGYPLMPGVLLIEAMAQTAGWLIIGATKFTRMPFFAAVKEAKLRAFVTPGQSLALSANDGSGDVALGSEEPGAQRGAVVGYVEVEGHDLGGGCGEAVGDLGRRVA